MSNRKGRRLQPTANHLKPDGQLLVSMATTYSRWFDPWWYEDDPTGGSKGRAVNWYRDFSPEEQQDEKCQSLINAARRLVYAMLHPLTVKKRSLVTVFGADARKLLRLVRWMYDNSVWSFSDITPEIADWYKSDILEAGPGSTRDGIGDEASCEELGVGDDDMSVWVLGAHLRVLVLIFELSEEFEPLPNLRIPEHPFRGESANSLAESLAVASDGWIPRIPEEVMNPLMQQALEWVDVRAADVLLAQQTYFEAIESRSDYKGKNHHVFTSPPLLEIVFDGGGTLSEPWRPPFSKSDPTEGGPTTQLRSLINDVEAASATCTQAVTGIRVSEFLAAKALPRQANGWPACLVQRASSSGLYDLFYFSSHIFKGEEEEEGAAMEWLIGVRPAGADFLPIAARAVLVLDKLYEPWRDFFGSDYLTVSLGAGSGLPKKAPAQTKPLASRLASVSREFMKKHVKLPEELADWKVTSHQYRKAFCQDIIRINSKALTAVQEHYGHASQYLTDEAYAGNDTRMLRLIDDVATREAAKLMVDRIYAGAPLGGKMAEVIDGRAETIRELLAAETTDERRITALANALSIEGIVLFTSDYIDCFFRGNYAMCHYDALGFFDSAATRPLRPYRTRKNCSVCSNGLINQHHVPYWIQDYRLNEDIRIKNQESGDFRTAAVAAARSAQARSVLRRFGRWPLDGDI